MHSSRNSGDARLPPQTLLGREGGKKNVDVSARTPTPPIAHNAPPPPNDILQRNADREARHRSGRTPDLRVR
jgi:hypothetical protein